MPMGSAPLRGAIKCLASVCTFALILAFLLSAPQTARDCCASSTAAQAKKSPKEAAMKKSRSYKQYIIKEEHFRCELPENWSANVAGLSDKIERIYGVEAVGPGPERGVPVRITVDYYSPNNTLFKNSGEYIDRNSKETLIKIKGDKYGPVKTITVSQRKAKTFEKETSIYLPPDTPIAKEVRIREKVIVLPASASEGFYVLRYYAGVREYPKYSAMFEHTVRSFRPAH